MDASSDKPIYPTSLKLQRFESGTKIGDFVVDKSAERHIEALQERLFLQVKKSLAQTLRSLLAPSFQFTHVNEAGLRIWGKEDNVAVSRSTLQHILNNLRVVTAPEAFKKAMEQAGRRAGLEFFDQFRAVLTIDNTRYVPSNHVDFLGVLAQFDELSGWWTSAKPLLERDYISIVVRKPFWRHPWHDAENHHGDEFLCGYLFSLYNAAAEYMNVTAKAAGWLNKKSYSTSVETIEEPDPNESFFRILITDKYPEDLVALDATISELVEHVLFNRESAITLTPWIEKKLSAFVDGCKLKFPKSPDFAAWKPDAMKDLVKSASIRTDEFTKHGLSTLLNDIRLEYQEKKAVELK